MRFCYAMLVLHECMFLHANRTFFQRRNTERERFYLQALRLRRNFYFGPPCQEDAITRKEKKKKNPEMQDCSFAKARSQHLSH